MKLSIVSTLYKSEAHIDEFCDRISAVARHLVGDEFEIILVNDGSPDHSLDLALARSAVDRHLTIIDLSRNFGHHKAMMTGLAHAIGGRVFLIDCDLEEEPEWLLPFAGQMSERQLDVVYGVQQSRRGGAFERWTGALFFLINDALSDFQLPRNLVIARLMTRAYVTALVSHQDHEFIIAHLFQLTGYRQGSQVVAKHSLSPTTYSVSRRVQMAVRSLMTTSTRILYIVLYFGMSVSVLSFLLIFFYIVRYLVSGIGVTGFTSLIVSIWFFGGMTMLVLGVISVYIANILSEAKRRPYTIIRDIHHGVGGAGNDARENLSSPGSPGVVD
ncbi:glycosyltransferase family 2 protein [Mesorhizobium sp. B2-5-13]|uniref:glycosyltransferase family 2 protein n=1 Tax=unclassified Mesorhizobium TaxID=325217 RepID=UPI0011295CFA|nr:MULTISPECIES: glycosyltransferase family 2 protein [unclassified Mesorhizobium]TPJ75500.1 glycosyltransferase family 2 protein [Mesorhizobium sp. B2-5-13]TPK41442.1 glycosyltransferase family 2 protein [Mesorhizobium sp. B2-5-5]